MRDNDTILLEGIYELLLEKDHRQKMMSFGIPEDVANYLHEFNDKYSLWFADQFNKMPGFQKAEDKMHYVYNRSMMMQHIIDWVRNTPNINLKSFTWDQAYAEATIYHENLKVGTIEGVETHPIIKKYDDMFYWADLEGGCDREEGAAMGHCGNSSAETLWSLRKYTKETNSIESFITLALNPDDGEWRQCKGKKNSKPKPEYHPYIGDVLIAHNVLKYRSEYNPQNDFGANDLKEYVEENADTIPNASELLKKIEESYIGIEKFKEILEGFDLPNLPIELDNDYEGEYIQASFYFQVNLSCSAIGILPQTFEDGEEMYERNVEGVDKLIDAANYNGGENFGGETMLRISKPSPESDDFSFEITGRSGDYTTDEYGLRTFKDEVDSVSYHQRTFDHDEFVKAFRKFCTLNGWIKDDMIEFVQHISKNYKDRISETKIDGDMDATIVLNEPLIIPNVEYPPLIGETPKRQINQFIVKLSPENMEYAKNNLPFLAYFSEFFTRIKEMYLWENCSLVGASDKYDKSKIRYYLTYTQERSSRYNFTIEEKRIEKLTDEYMAKISDTFYKFWKKVIAPTILGVKVCKRDEIVVLDSDLKKYIENSSLFDSTKGVPIYYKKTGELLDHIYIYTNKEDTEKDLKAKIDVRVAQGDVARFPKYDPKMVEEFFSESGGAQLRFKEFFESRNPRY